MPDDDEDGVDARRVMEQLSQVTWLALLILWVWRLSVSQTNEEFVYFLCDSRDFRTRLEDSLRRVFRVQARPVESSPEQVMLAGAGCPGIIDTGASKTVIGRLKTDALLRSLPSEIQAKVQWRRSSTVFRFGNNGVLTSLGAMYIPFGTRWLKVEVVEGGTPFLLSIAFLRALRAEIHVASSELRIPGVLDAVPLQSNPKGLFQLELADVLRVVAGKRNTSTHEEVITFTHAHHAEASAHDRDLGETNETDSSDCSQPVLEDHRTSLSSHAIVCDGGRAPPVPRGCTSGEFRAGGASGGSSSGSEDLRGMGSADIPSRSPCGQDVCSGGFEGSNIRQVHGEQPEAHLAVGIIVPELCPGPRDEEGRQQCRDSSDSSVATGAGWNINTAAGTATKGDRGVVEVEHHGGGSANGRACQADDRSEEINATAGGVEHAGGAQPREGADAPGPDSSAAAGAGQRPTGDLGCLQQQPAVSQTDREYSDVSDRHSPSPQMSKKQVRYHEPSVSTNLLGFPV